MPLLRPSRRALWILAVVGLPALVVLVDATLVEPSWIEVVRSVEYLPMVRPGAPDLTLVHLSDIHIGSIGFRERRAIEIVNESQPDIVVVTGDIVRGGERAREVEFFLSSLRARYGKFLVWGNHDYWDRVPRRWGPEVVRRAGFTLLANGNTSIVYPGGKLVIAGVDDPVTGHDNLKAAMTRVARKDACILLSHSSEIVENLGNWDIDLVLAGHTHGGQIRLPFVGALWVPFGRREYLEGWFDVPPGVRLHVSRGLGWSWIPVRFLCRPSIDVITLRAGTRPGRSARSIIGHS